MIGLTVVIGNILTDIAYAWLESLERYQRLTPRSKQTSSSSRSRYRQKAQLGLMFADGWIRFRQNKLSLCSGSVWYLYSGLRAVCAVDRAL